MPSDQNLYSHILQELEQRGNYETTAKPRDISKLAGIRQLLKELGNPQNSFKIIHIAGTNGKGLTGAMLSRILHQEGLKVGLYSSPHVIDIRERVILNGQWVSKENFAYHAKLVLEAADKCSDEVYLSYFDIFTAIALLVFQEAQIDWGILETGLGGKADSTNITDKELCIITHISYDHVNILGTSLENIAKEKMGIIRPNIPIVLGKQSDDLKSWMLQEFESLKSNVVLAEQLKIESKENGTYFIEWPDGKTNEWGGGKTKRSRPYLECLQNALMACQVIHQSSDHLIRQRWIQSATQVVLKGRLEFRENVFCKSQKSPFSSMILDGGHNPSAISALVRELCVQKVENYILILGIAEDKLIPQLQNPLIDLCQGASHIILTRAQSSRSASPEMLAKFISSTNASNLSECKLANTIEEALEIAYPHRNLPVVISGSFYLLGEFFQMLSFQGER